MTETSFLTSLRTSLREDWVIYTVVVTALAGAIAISITSGPAQILNAIVTGSMWALLSVGLALILGVMNIPHFAHGESFMVGAYVAYFVYNPIRVALEGSTNITLVSASPFAGILAAAIVGFFFGAMLERLVFYPLRRRTKEQWVMNTFLLTVGISFIMTNGTTLVLGPNYRGVTRYWDFPPLEIASTRIAVDRVVAFVIAILTIGIFWYFLRQTRTGRAIRAVSQDETGAELIGINLNFIHTLTFALATSMASMSGAILLFLFQAYPTVGLQPLYFSWYVIMLVGLGNVAGAIFGGFLVALLQSFTQQFVGIAWETVIPTVIMILVLLIAPSGIFGSEVKGIQEQ